MAFEHFFSLGIIKKMPSLKSIPVRDYFQAIMIFLFIVGLAFSTRWIYGKKLGFEVVWDPTFIQLLYPSAKLESEMIRAGKFALWDPYRGFGYSLISPDGFLFTQPLLWIYYLWGNDFGFEMIFLLRIMFAGFFAYVLARGIGLSHSAGLISGAGFMLCGYFRQFLNFTDLFVNMCLPLLILFSLRFFRRLTFFDFIMSLLFLYLLTTGAHPMPIYYSLGVLFLIAFYTGLEKALNREQKVISAFLPRILLWLIMIILAHLWSYVFPIFIELVSRSWTFHSPEIGMLHLNINHLIALFTPIFDYWLELPEGKLAITTPIPSYLGLFLCSLALFTIFNLKKHSPQIYFFWLLALLLLGIIFSLPILNFPGLLPLANRFQNFRYLQPLGALSLSILAGFGFEKLKKGEGIKFYLFFLLLLGIWLLVHIIFFWQPLKHSPLFFLVGMLLIVSIASLIFIYLFPVKHLLVEPVKIIPRLIFILTTSELFLYFIFPSNPAGSELYKVSRPKFLDEINLASNFFRIYSSDAQLLPPNTASLFNLRDVRERAPIYNREYFLFFSALNQWKDKQEAVEDFFQDNQCYLPLRLERIPESSEEFLFRYLLVNHRLGYQSLIEQFKTDSLLAPTPNYFSHQQFELNGKLRKAFLLHPPSLLSVEIKSKGEKLVFEIGLLAKEDSRSDGADFLILGKEGEEAHLIFARFLGRSEALSKGWIEYQVEINSSLIKLASLSGPKADPIQDFALFGSLELALEGENNNYQLISDSGPFLYQRTSAVPRFFLAPEVEWVGNQETALEMVREGKLSKEKIFLVSKPGEQDFLKVNEKPEGKIYLVKDETDLVELNLELSSSGWLVMLDSYYPGWRAFLDDKEVRIYRANYLFRAVWVPKGAHRIKFIYQPRGFKLGIDQSLTMLLTLFLLGITLIFRKVFWR